MDDENDAWPPTPLQRHRLEADRDGRVVLPAELVRQLNVGPHEVLLAYHEDGELRLETLRAALDKAHEYYHSRVTTGYMSDDLIADRRVEALREIWE